MEIKKYEKLGSKINYIYSPLNINSAQKYKIQNLWYI